MTTDDELHNLNIAENSATADALALKKKGKQAGQYTGYDDEEFAEGGTDAKASVLKKYDEEIEGKQESGFRLGGTVPVAAKGKGKGRQKSEDKEEKERVVLSMDYTSLSFPRFADSLLTSLSSSRDFHDRLLCRRRSWLQETESESRISPLLPRLSADRLATFCR